MRGSKAHAVNVMRTAVRGSLASRLPALLGTHVGWKVWLS